jgi:hypothetical protein
MNLLAKLSTGLLVAMSTVFPPHFHPDSIDCGTVSGPATGAEAGFWMETAPKARKRIHAAVCGWGFEKCAPVAIVRGKGRHALSWEGTTLIVYGQVDAIKLTRQVRATDDQFVSVKYVRRMPMSNTGLWLDRRDCRLRGPIVGSDP